MCVVANKALVVKYQIRFFALLRMTGGGKLGMMGGIARNDSEDFSELRRGYLGIVGRVARDGMLSSYALQVGRLRITVGIFSHLVSNNVFKLSMRRSNTSLIFLPIS